MRGTDELITLLTQAVERQGEDAVRDALSALIDKEVRMARTLTILGNQGVHAIPEEHIHGELYVATQGTLDLSHCDSIKEVYVPILRSLADKLRSKNWEKIYFIPTGPTTLALQIKLLVYHITRMSTIDLFYLRGNYTEIDLDYRRYLNESVL